MQTIRSEIAKDSVRYVSGGLCKFMSGTRGSYNSQTNTSTFDNYNAATELYRFTWTAWGTYNPTTKVTVEEITAPPPRVDEATPANRPYGRYRLEMICERDPWLDDSTSTRCTQPRVTPAGNLPPEVQAALKFTGKPFTALMKYEQRMALRSAQQKFDAQQAALARVGNQPVSAAGSTTRAGSTIGSVGSATPSVASRTSSVQGIAAGAATGPATGGTSTGTVSAALKLQAALDAQRAQQSVQGGAASAPAPAATPTPTPPASSSATPTPAGTSNGAAPTASKPATPSSPIAAVQPATLRITAPAPNSEIREGQLRVQVASSGAGARDVDVEFASLSPHGEAKAPARVQWTVPQEHAAQGVVVPSASGPRSSGRWQMRVRPAGSPTWSEPVTFDFVAFSEPKGKAWGRQANELERQGLNPQPLPPKDAAQASTQIEQRALNPQPLPPKEAKKANPFERQGLNPQPLPPKQATTTVSPADRQALNPQPLPPREPSAPASAFQR